jgi:hypothetical protein
MVGRERRHTGLMADALPGAGALPAAAPYQHLEGFLPQADVAFFSRLVEDHAGLLTEIHGRGGLGPRYRVIDGDQIRTRMPAIEALGQERVRPAVERFAGEPLGAFASPRRAQRVQIYSRRDQGFRWHRDGHPYVALVTLENGNEGQTQFISPRLSRVLRYLIYPLYPLPQLFSLLPRAAVTCRAGDLLIMRGRTTIHRGVTLAATGRRILFVYAFDGVDQQPSRLRDLIARKLNY